MFDDKAGKKISLGRTRLRQEENIKCVDSEVWTGFI
jgi:hypothetical protein